MRRRADDSDHPGDRGVVRGAGDGRDRYGLAATSPAFGKVEIEAGRFCRRIAVDVDRSGRRGDPGEGVLFETEGRGSSGAERDIDAVCLERDSGDFDIVDRADEDGEGALPGEDIAAAIVGAVDQRQPGRHVSSTTSRVKLWVTLPPRESVTRI